jgi:hypothetical protein
MSTMALKVYLCYSLYVLVRVEVGIGHCDFSKLIRTGC